MKKQLFFVFALLAVLLSAPTAFAEYGSTGTTRSDMTVTTMSATGAPVEMEIKLETDTGVQVTSVEPVVTSAPAEMCGGVAKPALSCPAGYMVGCNKVSGEKWACVKDPNESADTAGTSGASSGAQTGASAAGSAGVKTTDVRDMDDDGDTIDTILEDSAVRAAIFIKIDGVDGESSDDKKGSASSGASYDVKKNEGSREGAGEGFETGDVPMQDDFEVVIDSKKVRSLDEEKKSKLNEAAPDNPEAVKDEDGLALFVAATSQADSNLESVSLNFTKIEFRYKSDSKLFGIFPFKLSQDILLEGKTVSVKNPWYAFLTSGGLTEAELEAAAQKKKDKGHKDEIEIASWSFGASNAGKVNVAVGDVNGDGSPAPSADGELDLTLEGLATNFAILLGTVQSAGAPDAE